MRILQSEYIRRRAILLVVYLDIHLRHWVRRGEGNAIFSFGKCPRQNFTLGSMAMALGVQCRGTAMSEILTNPVRPATGRRRIDQTNEENEARVLLTNRSSFNKVEDIRHLL